MYPLAASILLRCPSLDRSPFALSRPDWRRSWHRRARTETVIYYRHRDPTRSLGDLNAWDQPQALRISDEGITQLRRILKEQFGLDYSTEQAQAAGRALLRFYGYKLLRGLEAEKGWPRATDLMTGRKEERHHQQLSE